MTACPARRRLPPSCTGTEQPIALRRLIVLLRIACLPAARQLACQLTMADHISALSQSCFFQLRQLRSIKQSLTLEATKTLVHAFVSSRLDYCNSMLGPSWC